MRDLNYYLTELRIATYIRAFAGFGFDCSIIALKIVLFGNDELAFTARWFTEQGGAKNYGDKNA